jgi:lysozyme
MKKEVQALINRRRARVVPTILLGVAALILVGIVWVVVANRSNGPGLGFLRTATPTVTATPTLTATPTIPVATDTPAATSTESATAGPSPTATQTVYTVAAGDNLFSIAAQFKANVCIIMAVNNITNPSVLTVGQKLIIPGPDTKLPTATSLPTGLARGARLNYVVQCGDTLDSIAAKFNSTGADITKNNNNIKDPLQVGQALTVRINIATPTAQPTNTQAPAGTAGATPSRTATP